jgi:uncharacterized tellurite resistance protein B-like protein
MSILRFLGLEAGASTEVEAAAHTDAVRQITEELEHLPPERARFIATFAYILGRVAKADLEISAGETRAMEKIVSERGGLPPEQAVIAVHVAKTRNIHFGGTDDFLVTREFNRISAREQKLALLDCLFAVSAAEGGITTVEDNEIRQISRELNLEHRDYIAVRLRYRDVLAVLRDLPRGQGTDPGEETGP